MTLGLCHLASVSYHIIYLTYIRSKHLMEFLKFLIGRRRCLGEILAKTNLFLFIAKLVQNFEIQIPPGVQLPEKTLEGVTISPSPFSAIFIPRRLIRQESCTTMSQI